MKKISKSDLSDAISKVKNVRYYTDDGTQVNKAISELEDMSPEMAAYIVRMAASYIFPDLRKSQREEVVSTFELDTPKGKAYFIQIG